MPAALGAASSLSSTGTKGDAFAACWLRSAVVHALHVCRLRSGHWNQVPGWCESGGSTGEPAGPGHTGLEEAQAGIKIAGRNINNLRYPDDTTLMAESEEELKSLLMKVEEEREKVGLKLNM